MELINLVVVGDEEQFNDLNNRFEGIEIKPGIFVKDKEIDGEPVKVIYTRNLKENKEYVYENFDIFKYIYIDVGYIVGDSDIQFGDVVIGNTFINEENPPIFLEYAIGENFDLKSFGLILNGVCKSGLAEGINEEGVDIRDEFSYTFLKEMGEKDVLDKTVVIHGILGDDTINTRSHTSDILELIL